MSTRRVAVILPAGGIGSRMGALPHGPKQLIPVRGRSILAHTIAGMRQVARVELIVVVTSEDLLDRVRADVNNLLNEDDSRCVAIGGIEILACSERGDDKPAPSSATATQNPSASVEVICRPASAVDSRHSSIAQGVEHLRDRGFSFVIVHDAVRPVVPAELVDNLLLAADEHGAAGPWVPLVSTVLRIDADGFIEDTIPRYADREGRLHVNSEMPQAFRYSILAKAYSLCDEHELLHGTECLELVRRYCGVRAKMLPGDADLLWKVTRPRDLLLMESELERSRTDQALELKGETQ